MAIILQDSLVIIKDSKQNCSNCKNCYKTWFLKRYKCELLLGSDLTDILNYGKCGLYEEN